MSREPVRVLILIGQLQQGGAERQVHELATRLDPREFTPTVATFEAGGHYQTLLEAAGIRVVVLDKKGLREAHLPLRLARLMRRLGTDVAHGFLFPANWRLLLSARLAGVRAVVCAVRSTGIWMNARHRMMDREALRRASVVVANAPAVREDIVSRAGLDPAQVRVIMNGVDTSRFHPGESPLRSGWEGGAKEGQLIVGFVGSLREAKDPLLFIRVAAETSRRHPGVRFVVVGEGPLRQRAESMAREANLADRIVFAGERSDMPDVLRAMDLLTVTSVREGCCNVILEAMATGVPVVATRVGGNPDLIEHGRTGWLFPHGDVAAGADSIQTLLSDPGLRARVGDAGLQRARDEFSVEAMVGATADLYRSLL
ncbi:MAG TPA: glycosyltransferase [Candidatus Polarisedimenticolia bacterium]|jgi:glycosyltransferase involved in cell wall biosynthesis